MQCATRKDSDPRIGVQAIRSAGERARRRPPPPSPLLKAKEEAKPQPAPEEPPAPEAPQPAEQQPAPAQQAEAEPAQDAEKKLSPEELRRHTRLEYETEVSMESGSQFFTGFTKNISAGGLFMATHDVRELGTLFRLRFRIPEIGRDFDMEAEVRWVCPPNPHRPEQTPGMGVRFLDLPEKDRRVLDNYIAGRETIFFDEDDD